MAYAATGRTPFGAGAPAVVAFRVMSGDPDLDGVPAPLRAIVQRALAKEPEGRPSAADAAEDCVELLASQVTQVVRAETLFTRAEDIVTVVWTCPPGTIRCGPCPRTADEGRGQAWWSSRPRSSGAWPVEWWP